MLQGETKIMKESRLLREMEEQQAIQRQNPPSSEAWQKASKRIHELANQLTGGKSKDACGRQS